MVVNYSWMSSDTYGGGDSGRRRFLVTVVVWLVGALHRKVEVLGLLVGEDGQLDVELREVSTSDFLV